MKIPRMVRTQMLRWWKRGVCKQQGCGSSILCLHPSKEGFAGSAFPIQIVFHRAISLNSEFPGNERKQEVSREWKGLKGFLKHGSNSSSPPLFCSLWVIEFLLYLHICRVIICPHAPMDSGDELLRHSRKIEGTAEQISLFLHSDGLTPIFASLPLRWHLWESMSSQQPQINMRQNVATKTACQGQNHF